MARHMGKRPLESRLAAQDRKYAEFWLLSYKEMVSRLEAARDIGAPAMDGMPHGSGVSDPTARRAGRVVDGRELKRFRLAVNVIETTLNELPEPARKVIDLVYIRQTHSDKQAMAVIHYQTTQYYAIRGYALDLLAERLLATV